MALSRSTKRRIIKGAATAVIIGAFGFGGPAGVKAFKAHQAKTRVAAIQTLSKAGVRTPERWIGFAKESKLNLNPRNARDQKTIAIIDRISKRTRIPADRAAEIISGINYSHLEGFKVYIKDIGDKIDDLDNKKNKARSKLAYTEQMKSRNQIAGEIAGYDAQIAKLNRILAVCDSIEALPKEERAALTDYIIRSANSREQ